MGLPLSAYIHRSVLTDANGTQNEGVNAVAVYYWDTVSLSWVKATGGAVPGANVNVTNFPAIYPSPVADGANVVEGATTDAAVTTNTTGTISGKLRGLVAILSSAWDSVLNALKISIISNGEIIDAGNSSTTNIAVGAPGFVGTALQILPYGVAQVNFKADQNCTIFVEQSSNGTNWDISDPFEYFASIGNFGIPVQLTAQFYRVRVINTGIATTTVFRLQSVLCPIHNPLPRALSIDGYLQCTVNNFQDDSGFVQDITPFGELISVPLFRVAGSLFNGSTLDTNFWTPATGTGGTVAPTNGLVTLATGTTANNAVSLISVYAGRFVGGAPNKTRQLYTLGDTGTANNVRQWGVGDATTPSNGAFFELNGTTFNLVSMKAGVRHVIPNGTFNGTEGTFVVVDTLPHFYEILYTPQTIWFYIDQELIHTENYTSTWSSTMNLNLIHTNTNSGGSTTNVSAFLAVSIIMREGLPNAQGVSKMIQGTTAGTTLKLGAGNLKRGIVSNITNNATVTIYDNTAASGTIIWASGAMGAQTVPFPLDFGNVEFSLGLTVVITTGANLFLAFE